ncbi:MAG: GNAT family N-acetyltransferase [Alphaproteobacteria bacterium]|nr:GNAT family N-acetyltransferase [Alphaproteobacteria bacterium]
MKNVYLRPLSLADSDRTWKWHNDPALYDRLVTPFRFVSRLSEEEWLRKKMAYSQSEMQLAICLRENDAHIGNIHLRHIDWVSHNAETGIFIGEEAHRGRGYGEQAMRLMLLHSFKDLGLQRIWLTVFDDNPAAIRSYEKCGFTVEGKLRKHALKHGRLKDLLYMAVNIDDPGAAWVRGEGA